MKHSSQNPTNKIRRWLLAAIVVVFIGILFWGIRWATFARPPLPEAVEALGSDDLVHVIQDYIYSEIRSVKDWFHLLSRWAD